MLVSLIIQPVSINASQKGIKYQPLIAQPYWNKLIQLHIASQIGLRVPATIVSQNPEKVKKFCSKLGNRVVIKPVRGTHECQVLTTMLRKEHLMCDDSISLCPTIYQEYVEGYQHIRAHCFGDNVYAAVLESSEIDWRSNLDVPFRIADVDVDLKDKLPKVTRALGLRTGIFDLKYIDKSMSPVWL